MALDLLPINCMLRALGPEEVDAVGMAHGGEMRVLREKANAGVKRIALLALGNTDNAAGVEIALVRGVATEAD